MKNSNTGAVMIAFGVILILFSGFSENVLPLVLGGGLLIFGIRRYRIDHTSIDVSGKKGRGRGLKADEMYVRDMSKFTENLLKSAIRNPDYDLSMKDIVDEGRVGEVIYENTFLGTAGLIRETGGHGGRNLVAVIFNGRQIGNVPPEKNNSVTELINMGVANKIEINVTGGKFKQVNLVEDNKKRSVYEMKTGEEEYQAILDIYSSSERNNKH